MMKSDEEAADEAVFCAHCSTCNAVELVPMRLVSTEEEIVNGAGLKVVRIIEDVCCLKCWTNARIALFRLKNY